MARARAGAGAGAGAGADHRMPAAAPALEQLAALLRRQPRGDGVDYGGGGGFWPGGGALRRGPGDGVEGDDLRRAQREPERPADTLQGRQGGREAEGACSVHRGSTPRLQGVQAETL